MTRVLRAIAVFLVGCVGTQAADDASAGDAGMDVAAAAVVDAAATDVFVARDTPWPDAAPDPMGLVCTGRPIPEGLTCVVQDANAVGPCEGRGGVAFDGTRCRIARGPECTDEGRGAFDSLEECGVTCAAAGHCDLGALFVDPLGPGVMPSSCGEAPRECFVMYTRNWELIPEDCAVWAPFSGAPPTPAQLLSSEVPYPDHWPILYSMSLAADVFLYITCDQQGPSM